MNDIARINSILARIVDLLRANELFEWAEVLEQNKFWLFEDPDSAISNILKFYGGMGSLNDLVLYKDGKVLINETNDLDCLRAELFRCCMGL
jgi:hypothetical protein